MFRKFTFMLCLCVVSSALLLLSPRVARANSVVTDCSSDTQFSQLLPAGGVISFQCACNAPPIVLTSTKVVNVDTELYGPCLGFTLSGNNVRRLFIVNPGKKLVLSNLTLANGNAGSDYGGAVYVNGGTLQTQNAGMRNNVTNGYAGGAIVSPNGNLIIEGTIFENNSASSGAAISATGNIDISGTTFTNNTATEGGGAALSVAGNVTVDRSLFANNQSPNGYGAIYTNGVLTIRRSTISDNSANTNGGGIYNLQDLELENVTISGNSAGTGGGGIYNRGTTTLVNVTIANNTAPLGGGIFHYAGSAAKTIALKNTLLAHGATGGNCAVQSGSPTNISSQGYNLSDDTSCAAYLNQTGDWNNLDAKLSPLQNNGDYYLLTHLPLPGSPAINRGTSNGAPAYDEQNVSRPQGTAFDIGAMEVCAVKPDKPDLYRPANNTKVKGTKVELVRGYAKCGDNYSVTVKDAATNQTVFTKKNIHDYTIKTTALTKGKTYIWFAQACNTIGCTKSDTWKFTVK